MTPAQYETLYNLTATTMLQADPTIKIAAISLSDTGKYPYNTYPSQATVFVKGMTLTPTPDAVTLHAYGTGTTTQTDFAIFNTLQAQFVADIKLFKTTFPYSAVWVTEFNADDAKDARNTNGFTTAFRPLGFAMFAKAGSQGFFPWSFEQSGYGDVDSSNTKSLGFQTDFVLENAFPGVPAGTSPDNFTYPTILQTVDSEPSNPQTNIFPTVNILATLNSDKSVTVMITNYAVANSSDVNQAGAARNVYLNVTALGTFSSGTEVDLNASTSTTTNATPSAISSTTLTSINNGTFQLNMAGYGTSVFNLKLGATNPAPTANPQTVTVPFNTATAITLTASGSGTLTYSIVAGPSHGILSGTVPSLTYTPTSAYVGADSFTFKANNGTDSNIATVTVNVQSAGGNTAQTINFPAPASPVSYGANAISLGATASSNLPVTYAVTGPGLLSGSMLLLTGQGTVTITAMQTGSSTYAAAAPVTRSIVVNPATLTVSISGSPSRIFGQVNPAFTYSIGTFVNGDSQTTATTGAPLITTIAVPKSSAGTTYPVNIATGSLAASNYTINLVSGTLTVSGNAAQSILFPALANFTHGTSTPLAAISTSGLAVTFTVSSGNATITNGNILTINGTGSVTITATQPGNSNFAAAPAVVRSFIAQ